MTFAETGQPTTARKRSFVIRGTRYGFKMGFQSTQRHLNASFLWSSVRSALDLYGNCYSRSRCQKSSFRYLVLISSFSWTVCLFLQDGKFHPNGSPCQVEKWRLCLFLLFLDDSIQSLLVSYSFSSLHIEQGFPHALLTCLRLKRVWEEKTLARLYSCSFLFLIAS